MDRKAHYPFALAKLIVIAGNMLDRAVTEGDASPSIKGERRCITVKIIGGSLFLCVIQDAL